MFAPVPDYLGLLRDLASFDPPPFVFGSVAEAALLDGALSASHGDLNVLIRREELALWIERMGERGFHEFAVYYEPRPGLPLVLGSSRDDLALELNLVDHDATGDAYFAVESGNGVVAIFLTPDAFTWPATMIDGVPIHTVSPLALLQIRVGMMASGVFEPPRREKDLPRQARLVAAFFPEADESSLEPRMVEESELRLAARRGR